MSATFLSRSLAVVAVLWMPAACVDTSGPPLPSDPGDSEARELSVVPRNAIIEAGGVVALQAVLIDEFGDRMETTVRWKSSDDAVATVAATGEVLGRSPGHAVITASAAGKSQFSTIRVLNRTPKGGGEEPLP